MSERIEERKPDKPPRTPKRKRGGSLLVAETKSMERTRRRAEQERERKFGRVHARSHSEQEPEQGPEEAADNGLMQHPYLDSQRFDGIDPNLNPEPPLNSKARTEYDNAQRDQNNEKQLRLGNMPKFSSTPTPRGPS